MKAVVDKIEDVPEPVRDQYEAKDGKFVLKVEGDHPVVADAARKAETVAEAKFRERNIAQAKELEALKATVETFKGVDPSEYRSMKERIADLEKQGVRGGEDVTKRVLAETAKAVEAAVAPIRAQLETEQKARAEASAALVRKNLEARLRDAGLKAGVDEEHAMEDFVARGMKVFQVKDGEVLALKGDGVTPVFGSGSEPLSPEEWAINLQKEAPHLYKPSKGGGATGGAGTAPIKYISSDPVEFGKHLEEIASGKVRVQ